MLARSKKKRSSNPRKGKTPSNFKDITGQVFGRWTVLKRTEGPKWRPIWLCQCSCGTERAVAGGNLLAGLTRSCGCTDPNKQPRKCSIPGCENKHDSLDLCTKHYTQLPHVREARAAAAKEKQKTPERREQKRLAQMRYVVSPKAILAFFHRWTNKRRAEVLVTDDQVLEFRDNPCHSCGRKIEGLGNGFILKNPRGDISLDNMIPCCGMCKLIKPKAAFDPIEFSKNLLRRFWKKTPMATIAKRRANKARGLYQCAACLGLFRERDTQIDHISPVVDPESGYINLDVFSVRLFCDDSNLQVLCKPCHSAKSEAENKQRRLHKKPKL